MSSSLLRRSSGPRTAINFGALPRWAGSTSSQPRWRAVNRTVVGTFGAEMTKFGDSTGRVEI